MAVHYRGFDYPAAFINGDLYLYGSSSARRFRDRRIRRLKFVDGLSL